MTPPDEIRRRTLLGLLGAGGLATALGASLHPSSAAHAAIEWRQPFDFVPTLREVFGYSVSYGDEFHYGVDYWGPPAPGAQVLAVAAGTVDGTGPTGSNGGLGNWVRINHGDNYWSVYAHMEDGSVLVSSGQFVGAGTPLGRVGTTGRSSAEHLHLEIRRAPNNAWVDPYPIINGGAPPANSRKEIEMLAFTCPDALPGWNFLIGLGYLKNAPGDQANHYVAATAQPLHSWSAGQTYYELWNHGLAEFVPGTSVEVLRAFLQSLGGGGTAIASWR